MKRKSASLPFGNGTLSNSRVLSAIFLLMKILITGASGFVGAHLCLHFLKKGHEVIAVQGSSEPWRIDYLRSEKSPGKLRTLRVDLTSPSDVQKSLQEIQPNVILNLAAYGAYPSQTDIERTYAVNFEAVRTLLEAAKGLPYLDAFIQAGSSSEYGANCTTPGEDAPTLPDSHYAVSKVAATQLVRFYALKHSLPAWTFRLYSVYGALEDSSRLIPKALLASMEGKLPPLANPKISRDFIHVDDVCQAFEDLIERRAQVGKGEIFNIGSGTRTRLEDLVALLGSHLGVQQAPSWGSMGDRAWDHPDWYSDPSKALKAFGWKAKIDLASGLTLTRDWLKAHPDWAQKALQNTVLAPRGI